jgi:hypothetical protein
MVMTNPTREESEQEQGESIPLAQEEKDSFRAYAEGSKTEADGTQSQWADYTIRLLDENKRQAEEVGRLKKELSEERRFCICGCPVDQHENYGEDGLGCENPNHECVLVCAAAASIADNLRLKKVAEIVKERLSFESMVDHHETQTKELEAKLARALEAVEAAREASDALEAHDPNGPATERLEKALTRLDGAAE